MRKPFALLLIAALLPLTGCTGSATSSKTSPYDTDIRAAIRHFSTEILSFHAKVHDYTIPETKMHGAYGVKFTASTLDYAFFFEAITTQFIGQDQYFYTYAVNTNGTVAEAFYGLDEDKNPSGDSHAKEFYFNYQGKANLDVPSNLTDSYFESFFPNSSSSSTSSATSAPRTSSSPTTTSHSSSSSLDMAGKEAATKAFLVNKGKLSSDKTTYFFLLETENSLSTYNETLDLSFGFDNNQAKYFIYATRYRYYTNSTLWDQEDCYYYFKYGNYFSSTGIVGYYTTMDGTTTKQMARLDYEDQVFDRETCLPLSLSYGYITTFPKSEISDYSAIATSQITYFKQAVNYAIGLLDANGIPHLD